MVLLSAQILVQLVVFLTVVLFLELGPLLTSKYNNISLCLNRAKPTNKAIFDFEIRTKVIVEVTLKNFVITSLNILRTNTPCLV